MKTYIVYSKRTNGMGSVVVQIETSDKREAEKVKAYVNSLPELCAWIEVKKS